MASTLAADGRAAVGLVANDAAEIITAAHRIREHAYILRHRSHASLAVRFAPPEGDYDLVGTLPPLFPEWLGDRTFTEVHGCRFPYVVGEMARGIATPKMVCAASQAGLMAFYGSAGLALPVVDRGLQEIRTALGPAATSWGSNLIHSPHEPELEEAFADLYLQRGVHRVSASAFMSLTPAIVRYACSGLHRDRDGNVRRRNHLFAKISRAETALLFMSPPPEAMLAALVARSLLTPGEAELAREIPLADDITVEGDSGGHTDNRPLTALLPTILALRDRIVAERPDGRAIRVGAAGGLGTPGAIAGAFAMGAAYVLTGSINQSAIESGLSEAGRMMLAEADIADVAMAPAADMFEIGAKVQVLKRGTLFAQRGQKLYSLYRSYDSLESLPAEERENLERHYFRASIGDVWIMTRAFFETHDPREAERGAREPHHRMALLFRWYLFHGSRWAADGTDDRRADFQIWCGPAMGAFNDWVRGSFLQPLENRTVVQIARNLLEGAAVSTRAQQLRACGISVPAAAFAFRPRPLR
jgi:trans-AT polyketide synthase/acyltransferase/oxidoreductase domain-containing protein